MKQKQNTLVLNKLNLDNNSLIDNMLADLEGKLVSGNKWGQHFIAQGGGKDP